MQPTLCTRCKKRVAVVFISKIENGQPVNEGLCLKCAKEIGLPQVGEMMRRMGITDEDLDMINDEMMSAFGGAESMEGLIPKEDEEDGSEDGKTATFPFLNRLFGGGSSGSDQTPAPAAGDSAGRSHETKERKAEIPGQLLHQPHRPGPVRQAGPPGGPGAGDRAGGPDPQPPAEE